LLYTQGEHYALLQASIPDPDQFGYLMELPSLTPNAVLQQRDSSKMPLIEVQDQVPDVIGEANLMTLQIGTQSLKLE